MRIDHFDDLEEDSIIKYIKTDEDFFPTADNGRVEVSLTTVDNMDSPTNKMFRICVWGEDDFGMEYETDDLKIAVDLFNGITDGFTKEHLKSQLFMPGS